MTQCYLIALSAIMLLAVTVETAMCGTGADMDAKSREAESRLHIEAVLAEYKKLAKVEYPTFKDVVFTLRRLDPTGRSYAESLAALELIRLGYFTQAELVEPVRTLHDKSDEKPVLKAQCIAAMLKLDPDQGLKMARYLLDDKKESSEAKLLVTFYLAEAGHADGFPIVIQAIETGTEYEYTLAMNAALRLKELEGKPVPGTAEIVSTERIARAEKTRQETGNNPPEAPSTSQSEAR